MKVGQMHLKCLFLQPPDFSSSCHQPLPLCGVSDGLPQLTKSPNQSPKLLYHIKYSLQVLSVPTSPYIVSTYHQFLLQQYQNHYSPDAEACCSSTWKATCPSQFSGPNQNPITYLLMLSSQLCIFLFLYLS